MTKRYREPVQVTTDDPTPDPTATPTATPTPGPGDDAPPAAFRWRGSSYRLLTVLGHWREDAGYWSGGGVEVPQRDLWRVEARNGSPARGVYELVLEAGAWRLDRVWD